MENEGVWFGAIVLFVVIAATMIVLFNAGIQRERARWEAVYGAFRENQPEFGDWTFRDRFVMTIAVGMDKSAIITHVRLMDGDKRLKELELRGDTCIANSVKGLPKESGVWECVVEEWGSANRREFRVTESRRVI